METNELRARLDNIENKLNYLLSDLEDDETGNGEEEFDKETIEDVQDRGKIKGRFKIEENDKGRI